MYIQFSLETGVFLDIRCQKVWKQIVVKFYLRRKTGGKKEWEILKGRDLGKVKKITLR